MTLAEAQAGLPEAQGWQCTHCGAEPALWTPSMTCYHWDAPQRSAQLTAEYNMLLLDCIGLSSVVARCNVEEQLVLIDVELEAGDPNAPIPLCAACAADYIEYMEEQWRDYYSGVL